MQAEVVMAKAQIEGEISPLGATLTGLHATCDDGIHAFHAHVVMPDGSDRFFMSRSVSGCERAAAAIVSDVARYVGAGI